MARFALRHSASRRPLQRFLEVARASDWTHFSALKQTFSAAGYVSKNTVVFDVGGNKYRVIAIVDFRKQVLLIDRGLTHEEYDRERL